MQKILEKIPCGVVAGACGILCFYFFAAVFGIQYVFAQVNGQTGQVATIFDTWWQTLIFVCAVVTAVLFAVALALFIYKKVAMLKGEKKKKSF